MSIVEPLVQLQENESMRKSRFKPQFDDKPFIFTKEARDVLLCLARYKYLRSSHLCTLTNRQRLAMNQTLRRWFDKRLIDKPKEMRRGYNSLYSCDIYMLTDKGAKLL